VMVVSLSTKAETSTGTISGSGGLMPVLPVR
jgi:hypothetical protein